MPSWISKTLGHPYLAPITEPFRNIKSHAIAPVANFFKHVSYALDETNYSRSNAKESPILRILGECFSNSANFITGAIGVVGGFGGTIGSAILGGMWAYNLAFTGFTSFCAVVGTGAVAGLVGMATAPFVLAVGIAAVGAVVGTAAATIPGFFRGCQKALQHRSKMQDEKSKRAAEELRRQAAAVVSLEKQIADMTSENRQSAFKKICDRFPDDFQAAMRREISAANAGTRAVPVAAQGPDAPKL